MNICIGHLKRSKSGTASAAKRLSDSVDIDGGDAAKDEGGNKMKIIITQDEKGLTIDFSKKEWKLNEVIGMIERAKMTIFFELQLPRTKANDSTESA